MKVLMIITYWTIVSQGGVLGIHNLPSKTEVVTKEECLSVANAMAKAKEHAHVKCVPMDDK